jgi:hypothetical protein
METARIVAGIVDDITSDNEDEDDATGRVLPFRDTNHNSDKTGFQLGPSPNELFYARDKMAIVMHNSITVTPHLH